MTRYWAADSGPLSEQAAAIFAMKAKGRPVAAIARATGLSRPTVYRVIDQQT